MADVAYTLQVGRKAMEHRLALVARTRDEALAALESNGAGRVLRGRQEARGRAVAFMFPGQGAQYVWMSRGLYDEAPVFRRELDRCAELLKPLLGLDLRGVIYPQPAGQEIHRWVDVFEVPGADGQNGAHEEAAAARLQQTYVTQPALFAVEYALAKQLTEWGVEPRAMVGHSIGEYVAACLAGVFELEDALALVAARGRLMQSVPAGSMLAVPLPEEEVRPLLGEHLSLASVNGRALCVVSGAAEAADALRERLTARGVTCTRLHTSHAFHSQMMEPILEEFEARCRRVKLKPPRLPFVSNLTGTWITEAEATDPSYWAQHLRHTVRFADGLRELLKDAGQVLLEVGPGQTLGSLAKQHPEKRPEQAVVSTTRHPREEQPDFAFLLGALGQLWLAGVEVNWLELYAGRRRRVHLPTYPFERRRYWVEARPQGAAPRAARPKAGVEDYFYIPVWKQSPLLARDGARAPEGEDSCWLLLADDCGLGARLKERLERGGRRVVSVARGEGWKDEGGDRYTVNPRQRQSYDALMKELKRRGLVPARILHLWNVGAEDARQPSPAAADAALAEESFYSLLFLAQSFGAQNFAGASSILVVSTGMQAVTGDEELRPEKATLLGPSRVIQQEYANLTCRSVDIHLPARADAEHDILIERLLGEFEAPAEQAVCAYRGRQRWVQTFEEVRLDERPARTSPLREGGVYLITGGQTQTGLVFAEHLAASVRARLVLVAPPHYPQAERWDDWLAADGAGAAEGGVQIRRMIETVRRLEAGGAEVLVINAHTADPAQMASAVARALRAFGAINGVLHTESVPGGGLIQLKTREQASAVLRPKVHATLSLDAALRDVELDFFALFSSSAALTGGIGQVDYCAANSFLSAFAHHRAWRRGGLTLALDWDPFKWEDWQGAQMGGAPDVQAQVKETLEAFGLTEPQSAEAFGRSLASGLPEVIVSRRDFPAILEQYRTLNVSNFMEQMGQQPRAGGAAHARPELSTPFVAPRNETERAIAEIWQELFGLEEVGVHDKFFELGGSSLLAIQLITRLRNAFGEEVSMDSIFEQPTVAGLAEVVGGERLGRGELEEVERVYEELKDLSPEELQALLADDPDLTGEGNINA
nr:malonyl CoA-acyl carrier protein transacylase [uncultured bacterium]